ncbi:MAG: tetratricopeptide repeat protein [Candidatus Brocadiia bacterium]
MSAKERTRSWKSLWLVAFLVLFVIVGGGLFVLSRRSPRHERLYVRGVLHSRSGSRALAAESFREAISLAPGYAEARQALIESLLAAREFEEAEQELNSAVERDLLREQEAVLRARIIAYRAAQRIEAAGPALTADICDQVVREELLPAAEALQAHAEQATTPIEAYVVLGDIWRQLRGVLADRRGLLLAAAERAARINRPEKADRLREDARYALAREHEAVEQAIAAWRSAIEADPSALSPRLSLARMLLETAPEARAEARELLEGVLQERPGHRDAAVMLAQMLAADGERERALTLIESIAAEAPRSPEVLRIKAALLLAEGRLEEADAASERLARIGPDVNALLLRANVLLAIEDHTRALPILQRVNTLVTRGLEDSDPDRNPEQAARGYGQALGVQLELARTEQRTGNPDAAGATLQEAARTARLQARYLRRAIEIRQSAAQAAWQEARAVPTGEAPRARVERLARALGDLYVEQRQNIVQRRRILDWITGLQETGAVGAAGVRLLMEDAPSRAELVQSLHGAARAYTMAMFAAPESASVRLALARQLVLLGPRFAQRVPAVLEPVLELDPENSEATLLTARALSVLGDHNGALERVSRLPGEMQARPDVLLLRAVALAEQERWQELERVAEALSAESSDSPAGDFFKGRVLLADGRAEEAAELFQSAGDRAQAAWPEARLYLAQALLAKGERAPGMQELEALLVDAPAHAEPGAPAQVPVAGDVMQVPEMGQVRHEAALLMWQELREEDPERAAAYAEQAFRALPDRSEGYRAVKEARTAAGAALEQVEDLALLHAKGVLARGVAEEALEFAAAEADALAELGTPTRLLTLAARLQARMGRYSDATETYRRVLAADPDDVRAARELGLLHVQLDQLEEARQVLADLLERRPDDANAVMGMVGVLLRMGQVEQARAVLTDAEEHIGRAAATALLISLSVQHGQIEDAIVLARRLTEEDPDRPHGHTVLAELLWRDGRADEARAAYNRAIEANPEFAAAYNRGLLDLAVGRPDDAVELFRRAAERLEGRLMPRVHLAVALQTQGHAEEALELLHGLLADERTGPAAQDVVRWTLAVVQAGEGMLEDALEQNRLVQRSEFGYVFDRQQLLEAISALVPEERRRAAGAMNRLVAFSRAEHAAPTRRELEALSELLPDQPMAALMHARVLDRLGEHEEAARRYRGLLERHPHYAFGWVQLADSFARQERHADAISTLNEGLEHAPPGQAGWLHLRLGGLLQEQGLLDEAETHYRAALQHRPVAVTAANNLAYLLAVDRADPEAALPLAEQAVELGGNAPALLDTLGWVHYLRGNAEQAVPLLERARRSLPTNPTVRYHLGNAYLAIGRTDEARAELREALNLSADFPEAEETRRALQELSG